MEQISCRPIESSTSSATVLAGWLRTWSRLRFPNDPLEGRTETEQRAVVAIYHELLSEIPVPQLDAACRRASENARFFPKPADIRALIDEADSNAQQLEEDNAWEVALDFATRFYDPDLGVCRRAPELPPKIWHAIDHTPGKLYRLWSCPAEHFSFVKKEFVAAYRNASELEANEGLLPPSRVEAKKFILQLAAQAAHVAPRELPPIKPMATPEPLTPNDIAQARAAFAELREKVGVKESTPKISVIEAQLSAETKRRAALTEEELIAEERAARTPEDFAHWLRTHERGKQLRAAAAAGPQALEEFLARQIGRPVEPHKSDSVISISGRRSAAAGKTA